MKELEKLLQCEEKEPNTNILETFRYHVSYMNEDIISRTKIDIDRINDVVEHLHKDETIHTIYAYNDDDMNGMIYIGTEDDIYHLTISDFYVK